MKKLLLVAIFMASVVHQEKAMEYNQPIIKDKDFSKQFFNELKDEYTIQSNGLKQQKKSLMKQRNSLETNLNLKKLNLNINEKNLHKNMKRSTSSFDSFMNTLSVVSCLGQLTSIMNDTDELKPIQTKLTNVTNELQSNLKLYAAFQELEYEYHPNRLKNPYLKKIQTNNPFIEKENKKESKAYDEALFSSKVTKNVMEYNLRNVSWFQWLWNYRAYKNYQKSIQTLDDEIALFKDQDKVVSPEKKVLNRGRRVYSNEDVFLDNTIKATDGKLYHKKECQKPQLTHREVFARSSMSQTLFEQVKRARE